MTSGQLIDALKQGKTLVRQTPLFPYDFTELKFDQEGELAMGGYGAYKGMPEDRIFHIIKHPEEWQIKSN